MYITVYGLESMAMDWRMQFYLRNLWVEKRKYDLKFYGLVSPVKV